MSLWLNIEVREPISNEPLWKQTQILAIRLYFLGGCLGCFLLPGGREKTTAIATVAQLRVRLNCAELRGGEREKGGETRGTQTPQSVFNVPFWAIEIRKALQVTEHYVNVCAYALESRMVCQCEQNDPFHPVALFCRFGSLVTFPFSNTQLVVHILFQCCSVCPAELLSGCSVGSLLKRIFLACEITHTGYKCFLPCVAGECAILFHVTHCFGIQISWKPFC